VPWINGRRFRIPMRIEDALGQFDALVGARGTHVCDSFSIYPRWGVGTCSVLLRQFLPHAPRHPGRLFPHGRWVISVRSAANLEDAAQRAGVQLQGRSVFSTAVGSLAAEAGIKKGWVLEAICNPANQQTDHISDGDAVVRFADVSAPRLELTFRDPVVSEHNMIPDVCTSLPFAYAEEAPWHDILPIWMRDGNETYVGPGAESEFGMQAEYFIPMFRAKEAISTVQGILQRWPMADSRNLQESGFLGVSELRAVKGERGLLCPNPVDCVTIHLSFSGHPDRYGDILNALPELERELALLGARPHWGKLFSLSIFHPSKLYGDGLHRFRQLARNHDPNGKFHNTWVKDALFTG